MIGPELLAGLPGPSTPSGDVSLTTLWPILGVMFVGAGGIFTFLVKHVNELRDENKELRNKVIDQVIPALTENVSASKSLVEATTRFHETMAVMEDRDRRGSRR